MTKTKSDELGGVREALIAALRGRAEPARAVQEKRYH